MITSTQLRAARALLGIDQRRLAELSGLSVPTIQRMEASEGVIRGNVDSLVKLVDALGNAGIELIGDGAVSSGGGRGVRLKEVGAEVKPAAASSPSSAPGREDENTAASGSKGVNDSTAVNDSIGVSDTPSAKGTTGAKGAAGPPDGASA